MIVNVQSIWNKTTEIEVRNDTTLLDAMICTEIRVSKDIGRDQRLRQIFLTFSEIFSSRTVEVHV